MRNNKHKMSCLMFICHVFATNEVQKHNNVEHIDKGNDELVDAVKSSLNLMTLEEVYSHTENPLNRLLTPYLRAIFAHCDFRDAMIQTKFKFNQVLCIIMQKLARNMLTCEEESALEMFYLIFFVIISQDITKYLTSILEYHIDKLNDLLYNEYFNFKNIGLPCTLEIGAKGYFTCSNCGCNYEGYKTSVPIESRLKRNLQRYVYFVGDYLKYFVKINSKNCPKCDTKAEMNSQLTEFMIPRSFMIWHDPNKPDQKDEEDEMDDKKDMKDESDKKDSKVKIIKIDTSGNLKFSEEYSNYYLRNDKSDVDPTLDHETLIIGTYKFKLYALVCFKRDWKDNISYSYTVLKEGSDWYNDKDSDSKPTKLEDHCVEIEAKYDFDRNKRSRTKNKNANGCNGWIYFFKYVE